jgi:O-methyltransferase
LNIKSTINQVLKNTFGLQIRRISKSNDTPTFLNSQNLLFEKDVFFNETYDQGIRQTGTPKDDVTKYFTKRRIRFYNTIQFFLQTSQLKGAMAECGCFRGLSSYLLCNYQRQIMPGYKGENFTIIDSFEGLSIPSKEDAIKVDDAGKALYALEGGHFATPLDHLRKALSDFPEVTLVKGWIPDILPSLPDQSYKYVHIDLDLYEPIKGALEYFYPKMVPGGIIVMDDYGSLYWPGAKKAVEEFCEQRRIQFLTISSAQAIIWKR